jgi:transposase
VIYSKEIRREVLAACDAGGGTREVATRFDVSESWVRRIKQERRESGKTAPKTTRDRRPLWSKWSDWLRQSVAAQPDIYLRELQAKREAEHSVTLSEQTFCTACRALGLTRKKRR